MRWRMSRMTAGRRGDDADRARQIRDELLARRIEQAFGGKPAAALLQQRHQRADAGGSMASMTI